jgi:hypothetical protein
VADRQLYIVFGNPTTPDQDGEFNDWYNNIHIPDVLAIPGVLSAQRYKRSLLDREVGRPVDYGYVTVYEFEGDPNEVMAKIGAGVASGTIRMDGAPFDRTKVNMAFWTPVTEKVEAE